MNAGINKLIYFTFNDIIKLLKTEHNYDLSYLKCKILNNNKHDQTIRTGEYIWVNSNLGFILKNDGIVFDNYKKFFVLAIAKELGKEVIDKYWDTDKRNECLNIIAKYDINDGYKDDIDKLSTYFSLKIYSEMLPRLNHFVKKEKKEGNPNERQ